MRPGRAAAAAARALGEVQVGIEFEFVVPPGNPLYRPAEEGRTITLAQLEHIDQIEAYFEAPCLSTWLELRQEYEEWVQEERGRWIDENWGSYVLGMTHLGPSDREEIGREVAAAQAEARLALDPLDWVRARKGSWLNLVRQHGLSPAFGWHEERGDDMSAFYAELKRSSSYQTQATVAMELSRFLRQEVRAGGRGYATWKVEPDSSLRGGHDVEIVSPPLSWHEARQAIEQVLEFSRVMGLETNDSTGLHLNVSTARMDRFNPVKFVVLLDDEHALRVFGRSGNEFALSQLAAIRALVSQSPPSAISGLSRAGALADLETMAAAGLRRVKYSAINLEKLKAAGLIEVRIAGGRYQEKLPELLRLLDRVVVALRAALDPWIDRRAYLKKLFKLLVVNHLAMPGEAGLAGPVGVTHGRARRENRPCLPGGGPS